MTHEIRHTIAHLSLSINFLNTCTNDNWEIHQSTVLLHSSPKIHHGDLLVVQDMYLF